MSNDGRLGVTGEGTLLDNAEGAQFFVCSESLVFVQSCKADGHCCQVDVETGEVVIFTESGSAETDPAKRGERFSNNALQ